MPLSLLRQNAGGWELLIHLALTLEVSLREPVGLHDRDGRQQGSLDGLDAVANQSPVPAA
ncbi:hypothetical protein [Nonomuraea sp. NPDC003214]